MKKIILIALSLILVSVMFEMVACGNGEQQEGKIGVVVTILPQAEFVENIGGDKVDVTVMVPSGASPHTYEPTPSQMVALSDAEMYAKVGSGIDFELTWMDDLAAQNGEMLIVDCSEGVELQQMTVAGEDEPAGGTDPHIWMSPLNAIVMVSNITEGLVKIDPDNSEYYRQNRDAYITRLTQLDSDIRDGLSAVSNRVFMVFHPAFGYFAAEYDLTMLPIEDEGKEPNPAGLQYLIEQAKYHNIKVVFAEPQYNPQSAEVIAGEIGGRVVLIDPLARNYISSMETVLAEMAQAME